MALLSFASGLLHSLQYTGQLPLLFLFARLRTLKQNQGHAQQEETVEYDGGGEGALTLVLQFKVLLMVRSQWTDQPVRFPEGIVLTLL
jgi:hypothetical protein